MLADGNRHASSKTRTSPRTRRPARALFGLDDAGAPSDALQRFRQPAGRICVFGGGLRFHFSAVGGPPLDPRVNGGSLEGAYQVMEAVAQDLLLSLADAGAGVHRRGGGRNSYA